MADAPRVDASELRLGEPCEPFALERRVELREWTLALVRQARRTIDVVSLQLEPTVYDTPEMYAALREFVLGSRRARLRVLLLESGAVAARGHRLVELAQRLSTYVEVRRPAREHAGYGSDFLVADRTGYVLRINAARPEARVSFGDRRRAQTLAKELETMWSVAEPDPNLRRLSL